MVLRITLLPVENVASDGRTDKALESVEGSGTEDLLHGSEVGRNDH